jgi:Putative zinc-finger
MECQDATAHIADYLAGSLPVEELEALLTHAAACAACSDKLTVAEETWQELGPIPLVAPDLPAMRRRFNAVLASYQDGLGGHPRRDQSAAERFFRKLLTSQEPNRDGLSPTG